MGIPIYTILKKLNSHQFQKYLSRSSAVISSVSLLSLLGKIEWISFVTDKERKN